MLRHNTLLLFAINARSIGGAVDGSPLLRQRDSAAALLTLAYGL